MSASFEIIYHPDVLKKDLRRISHAHHMRIRSAIETKLMGSPEEFGEPLRRTLKGYWKLRVGEYRVIYKMEGKTIVVLQIGHRSDVYKAVRGF